jgi:hypothetical protein
MPAISRWLIKASFVYFLFALLIGVILGLQSAALLYFPVVDLYPTCIHILTEGRLTMLIIGVAIWMFPNLRMSQPRGKPALSWNCFILLNAGLLLRIISEPVVGSSGVRDFWSILLALAAILQWLGGTAFVILAWGRVKVR